MRQFAEQFGLRIVADAFEEDLPALMGSPRRSHAVPDMGSADAYAERFAPSRGVDPLEAALPDADNTYAQVRTVPDTRTLSGNRAVYWCSCNANLYQHACTWPHSALCCTLRCQRNRSRS